ncbi:DNA-binding protein [Alkalilimnicola ehrlichii]|uniref:DNA-binding protein n=1 Tax=Alkalilimnicola ehrlichii TaxID=351052 RepID=A0A3E0X1R9_9GAMM|nr:PIN domain-containing protein [Alkalilimnicola ehrlichii]RFA30802.1 DNA-binding protein [Alkalilimnicola ehrlichii]RFA38379.1 DNA-binding protein [Alkalilimnicola ehrlichii]
MSRSPVLVDSCVLLDVLTDDSAWADWSVEQLEHYSVTLPLLINPIVYAEISIGYARIEELEAQIKPMKLKMQNFKREALFLAGKIFVDYRRRGGTRRSPLPDFFIGAQAATEGWQLLTRDAKRYRTYFPTLALICP